MSKKEYSADNIINAGQGWPYTSAASLFLPRIMQRFLSDPEAAVLKNRSAGGTLLKPFEEVLEKIKSYGGVLVRQDHERDFTFLWKDSYVEIDYNKKTNSSTLASYFLDPKIDALITELEKDFLTKTKKNLVFSIVQTSNGLEARSMGDGSTPLIEDNYNPEVLENMKYVIQSFGKTPPIGRIAILNGEPGTGKTHLIRSMFSQLDCLFLIVPANLIDAMDKPTFMPLLMSIKDNHEKPIVMIIEDGDTCLVPRKSDNISVISTLLNLSDGIMGGMIDIRMVISTNANIKEIDEAIKRPGRLCKQIHVGPLDYDRANKVYRRLMADENANLPKEQKEYTLAQIYDRFHNKDAPIVTIAPPKRAIGFSSRSYDDTVVLNKKE